MSEYHKIETLYERDEKSFKVKPGQFKNRTYTLLKTWHWTEKVDGTNIRVIWQGGKLTFGGKSDNAQLPSNLVKWLYANVTEDKLRAVFPDTDAVIYGEGYGAGIQKGGNYSSEQKLIVFDVRVGEFWLNNENMRDVAAKLDLAAVPSFGEMSLEDATELVRLGFESQCAEVKGTKSEGLVGRPLETLFDKKGARLIVKLKTKDF